MGVLCHTLPGYYGLKTGSWKHWARVWDVDYEYLLGRFHSKKLMEMEEEKAWFRMPAGTSADLRLCVR